MLAALRLGLHELLYLSGAPDRAVVADAVELAKGPWPRRHGLVNAVLRRAAREGAPALLGSLDDRTPERAAVPHSHPEWIARLWWQRLGAEDARALLACDNEPGEVSLRANTLVTDPASLAEALARQSVPVHADEAIAEALVLDGPFDPRTRRCGRRAPSSDNRARRCSSRARWPRHGASACSTCAPRPAARRRTWRR